MMDHHRHALLTRLDYQDHARLVKEHHGSDATFSMLFLKADHIGTTEALSREMQIRTLMWRFAVLLLKQRTARFILQSTEPYLSIGSLQGGSAANLSSAGCRPLQANTS